MMNNENKRRWVHKASEEKEAVLSAKEEGHVNVKIMAVKGGYVPRYETKCSAGMDVRARLDEPIRIPPFCHCLVPVGFVIELPTGYEAQIRPRSGLALKFGVSVLNAPGTIDSDYRGEVCVILVNHGQDPFTVEPDMRIAQMVISRYERAEIVVGIIDSKTERDGGFGSTGLK